MTLAEDIAWDAHSCVPLNPAYPVERIVRHLNAGFGFVSINVGMDVTPEADILGMITAFSERIESHPRLRLVRRFEDVAAAGGTGQLAVAFDLEGAVPLDGDPDRIATFHGLGIRQMHFAYNRANDAAGGCYDPEAGLTALGEALVARCEEAGVIVDCAHLNDRSALRVMEIATKPVVISHANARALHPDLRNVTDEMIDACAATGGVIGLTGMSRLYPGGKVDVAAVVRQIDHVVQRVGPSHAGIGLDYVYDQDQDVLPPGADPAHWFPPEHGYDERGYTASYFLPPEMLEDFAAALARLGYASADIAAIRGGNFARVARACWGA